MKYVIKAMFPNPLPQIINLGAQKTMYGGKTIAAGATIYLFADRQSERAGLVAIGSVVKASAAPKIADVERQTPRVDITIRIETLSRDELGREQLHVFNDWKDGGPQTELNFKLYRQATSKIVGISDAASIYLDGFFH